MLCMLHQHRPLLLALALAATASATSLAACNTGPEEEPTVEEVGRHQHGVVNAVIDTALARAELTSAQLDAVTALQAEVATHREARKGLRDEMRLAASSVVRSGTADTAQFQAMVDKAAAAIEEHVQRSAEAVKEVHAMLSPDQRAAVAEGLRLRVDQKWGKARRDRRDGMKTFAEELMLNPEQVAALEKIKNDLVGQSKQLKPSADELYDLIDAFETDEFGAALDAFHAEKAPILRGRLATAGDHADTVLGLLEAEQRDALADIIEHGRDVLREER